MTDLREKVARAMHASSFETLECVKKEIYLNEAQVAIDTVLAELKNDTGLYDRLGSKIMVGNIVHWSDGGEDLPIEERIATRWDRIAVVGKEGIMPCFTVIDSPNKYTKNNKKCFEYGGFIYDDTENHLTVVAQSEADYHAKFKNAGDCMRWVSASIAKLKGE